VRDITEEVQVKGLRLVISNGDEIGRHGDAMKKTFLTMTCMLALAFLAATSIVRAKEPPLANIPFVFTGKMALPAGE